MFKSINVCFALNFSLEKVNVTDNLSNNRKACRLA